MEVSYMRILDAVNQTGVPLITRAFCHWDFESEEPTPEMTKEEMDALETKVCGLCAFTQLLVHERSWTWDDVIRLEYDDAQDTFQTIADELSLTKPFVEGFVYGFDGVHPFDVPSDDTGEGSSGYAEGAYVYRVLREIYPEVWEDYKTEKEAA